MPLQLVVDKESWWRNEMDESIIIHFFAAFILSSIFARSPDSNEILITITILIMIDWETEVVFEIVATLKN